MSRINHYQALTGVHPSLIWPVWARFNNWLPDGRIFVGLQQRLDGMTLGELCRHDGRAALGGTFLCHSEAFSSLWSGRLGLTSRALASQ